MFPEPKRPSVQLNLREVVTKEISAYLDQPAVHLDTNPIEWWMSNADNLELLARLAKHMLVIQGTSVASERVFSMCGDTVNAKRSCLTGEHVGAIVFLNKNCSLYQKK